MWVLWTYEYFYRFIGAMINAQGIITCYLTKILIRYPSIPWFNKEDTRAILGRQLFRQKKPDIYLVYLIRILSKDTRYSLVIISDGKSPASSAEPS